MISYVTAHRIYIFIIKMSKSPIKDYSRLLGYSRTLKKEDNVHRHKTFDTSSQILDELKAKLEMSLKHNAKLLDENSVLSQLVSELRHETKSLNNEIQHLRDNEKNLMIKSETELTRLMDEIAIKQSGHEQELRRLLSQISTLHQEKNDLEFLKNKELESFKNGHEKNMLNCMQELKNTYSNSKQIYETEKDKLKEVIESLEHEQHNKDVQKKLEVNRLNENIKNLESQIRHIRQLNALEVQELKKTYQNQLTHEKRGLSRERQVELNNLSAGLRRLKNDIADKNQEIQALNKKMSTNEELHSGEVQHLKREKESLLADLNTKEVHYANQMLKDKLRLKQMNDLEVKNVIDLNQTHIEELRSEVKNLKNLEDCRKDEIKRIYEEIEQLKQTYGTELEHQSKQNQELTKKLREAERDYLEGIEAFKIKISGLVDADLQSITSYFQNQMTQLTNANYELEKINKASKEKLYQALQDNDEIRKYFEVELSKQKARVQDLKIKMAAANLEYKEYATSLGSKIEMTSMTMVREAEQKQRSQSFFDEEKKKFHSLTNAKDKEIAELMETMHRMKKMHEDELKVLRNEKQELRDAVQDSEDRLAKTKIHFEDEIKRREESYRNQQPEEDKTTELLKGLYDKNEQIENENIKLQKQVEHLARENRSMAQDLGLKKGYIENLQLESCAAIEDEKSKLKIMMGNSEITLREYYEDKVHSREKDNEHLKKVVAEKESDIRELIVKYNGLEKRLEMLLEAQEKARDLEQKVKNLGMDNNLVKNMAELFNRAK